MSTFRNQMRVKCELSFAELTNHQLFGVLWGVSKMDRVSKALKNYTIIILGPQYYTGNSYLGNKFRTVAKHFSLID